MVVEPVRIQMPWFWPRTSTTGIQKLLKIPVALLRQLNMRLIIYLDDMLVYITTREESLMSCENVICILQFFGFVKYLKKLLIPVQDI